MTYPTKKKSDKKMSNDSVSSKLIGDQHVLYARDEIKEGDYRGASKSYLVAMKSYAEALNHEELDARTRNRLEARYDFAKEQRKENLHKAAIYKATERKHPFLMGLLRKVRAKFVLLLFLASIIFSFPNLTGASIGISNFSPIIGIIFFLLFLMACYLLIWKNFLIRRTLNQY